MNHETRVEKLMKIISETTEKTPVGILKIYENASKGGGISVTEKSEMRNVIVKELVAIEADFEKWDRCHSQLLWRPSISEFRKVVADKLAETAKTFNHWHSIFRRHVFCLEYTETALEKMKMLATDERELGIIQRAMQHSASDQGIDDVKLIRSITSFNEWLTAVRQSIPNSIHQEYILGLVFEIDVSFEVLCITYRRSRRGSIIRCWLTKKIEKAEAALEDWCRVYIETSEHEELRVVALKKMRELLAK